jgi:predicted negative regulator of RcsB-dependent stress response
MAQYNDDERVDDIKKWWKENGASIIAGIVLGLIAIFGWQYWNSYRDAQAEKASLAYDGFVEAVERPDTEQARQRGQALLTDFAKSSYAVLAALQLAKLEMDEDDTVAATQHLEWVIANARVGEFKDIARLRLARVLFTAERIAEARKLLDDVTTVSVVAEREELKGDLYLAGGDIAQARAAYTAALAVGGGSPLLQFKLDNLTPATAESVVTAPPTPPTVQPEPLEATESTEPVEPAEETTEPVEPIVLPNATDHETAPAPPPSPPASGQ